MVGMFSLASPGRVAGKSALISQHGFRERNKDNLLAANGMLAWAIPGCSFNIRTLNRSYLVAFAH